VEGTEQESQPRLLREGLGAALVGKERGVAIRVEGSTGFKENSEVVKGHGDGCIIRGTRDPFWVGGEAVWHLARNGGNCQDKIRAKLALRESTVERIRGLYLQLVGGGIFKLRD